MYKKNLHRNKNIKISRNHENQRHLVLEVNGVNTRCLSSWMRPEMDF